ncbi:hypothetical protein ACFONN_21435, partial [Dyella humi]
FPSGDYLVDVLRQAMDLLTPGGRIYVGDVRNLKLLRCFATAIAAYQPSDDAAAADESLQWRINQNIHLETELLLDPDFFAGLKEDITDIAGVDIQLKRGWSHNELTRYRYEVVLHKQGTATVSVGQSPLLAWGKDIGGLEDLKGQLLTKRPAQVRIGAVPNPRLSGELDTLRTVWSTNSPELPATDLSTATGNGVEPEAFHALGGACGYRVATTWSSMAADGSCYDVVLIAPETIDTQAPTDIYLAQGVARSVAANKPSSMRYSKTLNQALRAHLARQ